ncbi:MAG: uridine kinase [Oscillospiraceae bacterium]|nr:uridine kinase [Oscillospiraceae bacterium]
MKKFELISKLSEWDMAGERKIIAIDGRCASGKTTLALFLADHISCDIVHTDDFFLPFEKRTDERLSLPGGNIDHERLLSEILLPLKNGESYTYSKFSCKNGTLTQGEKVVPTNIMIVEGSYSCHPELFDFYDLHIFLYIDKELQKQRILQRNKDKADMFFEKWIPLEEKYFSELNIKDKCEIVLSQEDI